MVGQAPLVGLWYLRFSQFPLYVVTVVFSHSMVKVSPQTTTLVMTEWYCCIWATQVLETLAKTGVPSRSEITDAAMGERAECVMLNKGPHIVAAIEALDDILRRMSDHQRKNRNKQIHGTHCDHLPHFIALLLFLYVVTRNASRCSKKIATIIPEYVASEKKTLSRNDLLRICACHG